MEFLSFYNQPIADLSPYDEQDNLVLLDTALKGQNKLAQGRALAPPWVEDCLT